MRLVPCILVALSLMVSGGAAPSPAQTGSGAGFIAEGQCLGDCDGDRVVDVAELLRGVRIALGEAPRALCPAGGIGGSVFELVGSVRNALLGCETVRDFSDFTSFSYGQQSALGFCPQPGSILSASLVRGAEGTLLSITRVAAPAPGCYDWFDPRCVQTEPPICRRLGDAETTRVRDAFSAVTTYHAEDPVCLEAVYDPCVIRVAQWGDESYDDYPHSERRLPDTEMRRLEALLDSLTGESDTPCSGVRAAQLDELRSTVVLQTVAFPIGLAPRAALQLTTRPADPYRGDLRVEARPDDLRFAPIPITGLVCVCAAARRLELGDGEALAGAIYCGDDAEQDLDVEMFVDHNTTPGASANRGGLPDDPECDNTTVLPSGSESSACLEQRGAACSRASHVHTDVCNSPMVTVRERVPAPRGSARIDLGLQLTLLQDAGACAERRRPNGDCIFADYGADCLPCTADDVPVGIDAEIALTTGRASAHVYDLNNGSDPGRNEIADGVDCFGVPCVASATGSPFDCDALAGNPTGGVDGAVLVGALPRIDEPQIGDTVLTFTLALRDAQPAPPP